MSQAAGVIKGIFDRSYLAGGSGIRQGVALIEGSDDVSAIKSATAKAAGLGICADSGSLPDGTASSTSGAEDKVTAQKAGTAAALIPASATVARGDQAVNDANALFVTRTPFSISAFVWGRFSQSRTAGSTAELVELELRPHQIEVVRQVTTGTLSTFGANTKYLAHPGIAQPAAQVVLYVARFAGETIRSLFCNLVTAPGGSDTVSFTVQKSSDNGATWTDTALTATISAAAKSASDLTHSAVLAAGDLLAVKTVSSGTTAAVAACTFDIT